MHFQNEGNCSLQYVYTDFTASSQCAQSEELVWLHPLLSFSFAVSEDGVKETQKLAAQSATDA